MRTNHLLALLGIALAAPAQADGVAHRLADAPFAQDWSNAAQLIAPNEWSGVPALEGYLSGDVLLGTGNDPRNVLDFAGASLQVTPNVASLAGYTAAGVIEAAIADPVVALQATNNNDVAFLLLRLDTTGCSAVQLSYRLRDLDTDTAVQPWMVQSRVGDSGTFAEVPGTYEANANSGGDVTYSVALPTALTNQSLVQLRWITTNVPTADALIGVDDIAVTGTCSGGIDNPPQVNATSPVNGAIGVSPGANLSVAFSEAVTTAAGWFALACSTSGAVPVVETAVGNSRNLDPVPTLVFGETCTASIDRTRVTDLDGTPDPLPADVQFGFTIVADLPPSIATTSPTNNATNVPLAANVLISFSEPVAPGGNWFAITCTSAGAVAAVPSGGPTQWTLDPGANFSPLDSCTVTLDAALVLDLDGNPDPLAGTVSFGFTTGAASGDYYAGVDASNPAALRATLHALIDDHQAYPYTATATDVWDILEAADQDPLDPTRVLDVYRNRKYVKVTDRSGSTGPGTYNREHTWPNSLGFNDLNGLDTQGRPWSPYVDTHMLYLSASDYNQNRGNKPYDNCPAACTENPTDANNGSGGGTGIYPGNSNWVQGSDGNTGTYEAWGRRKGDLARAILYMDIRYEGGSHANGQAEPDLIVTDNRALIQTTPSGQVPATGYMGVRSTLVAWHFADPPDEQERLRNEVIFSYQGNRNPFIDRPEFAACLWQAICSATPPDGVFASGFEP